MSQVVETPTAATTSASSKAMRAAVFTINNYTEQTTKDIKAYCESGKSRYCIIGFEEAPSTGTPHIQGYIQFTKPSKIGRLAKLWKAWFNAARGTPQENKAYCSKDKNFLEFGDVATQESGGDAEKERWNRNIQLAKAGNFDELERLDPYAFTKCYHTYKRMHQDFMPRVPDRDVLDNHWIYGAPGVGKSRGVREQLKADGHEVYYEKPLNKWWDGYQDEKAVIIDDLDKNHEVLSSHIKHWADHYAFLAEIKGGSKRIRPLRIIVTSNYTPEEIFKDPVTAEAIRRRFTVTHVIGYDRLTKKFT